jgi:hypothetical protein
VRDGYIVRRYQIWPGVGERLLKARTERDALLGFEGTSCKQEFEPLASLILQVLREPDFPRRDPEAQANFLAESLAARHTHATLTPRHLRSCIKIATSVTSALPTVTLR